MGLLIGCELIPQLRAQLGDIQKAALKAGLIILTAGGTTIRLCPPLIIKKREITEGVAILKSVLKGFLANLPKAEEPVKAVKTGSRKTRASAKEPAVKQVKPAAKTRRHVKLSLQNPLLQLRPKPFLLKRPRLRSLRHERRRFPPSSLLPSRPSPP